MCVYAFSKEKNIARSHYPLSHYPSFKGASQAALVVKNLPANARDSCSIPGSRRSLGRGHGNPLQYPCLGNSMGKRAWWATIHKSHKELDRTEWLSSKQLSAKRKWGWEKADADGVSEWRLEGLLASCSWFLFLLSSLLVMGVPLALSVIWSISCLSLTQTQQLSRGHPHTHSPALTLPQLLSLLL